MFNYIVAIKPAIRRIFFPFVTKKRLIAGYIVAYGKLKLKFKTISRKMMVITSNICDGN